MPRSGSSSARAPSFRDARATSQRESAVAPRSATSPPRDVGAPTIVPTTSSPSGPCSATTSTSPTGSPSPRASSKVRVATSSATEWTSRARGGASVAPRQSCVSAPSGQVATLTSTGASIWRPSTTGTMPPGTPSRRHRRIERDRSSGCSPEARRPERAAPIRKRTETWGIWTRKA